MKSLPYEIRLPLTVAGVALFAGALAVVLVRVGRPHPPRPETHFLGLDEPAHPAPPVRNASSSH